MFDWLHLSVDIGEEGDIFFIFMDAKTKHSVFCLIGVLVVEQLFFGVGVDVNEAFPDGFGEKDSGHNAAYSELAGHYFVGYYFFID